MVMHMANGMEVICTRDEQYIFIAACGVRIKRKAPNRWLPKSMTQDSSQVTCTTCIDKLADVTAALITQAYHDW